MSDPSVKPDTLTPDDWEHVKDMVFACLPLDQAAREHWLDERGVSPRVRREVERLLAQSHSAGTFMDVPAPQRVLDLADDVPKRIDHFRIERELGSGGMGVVYAAVDERLGRPVAIKVLQPDAAMDETRRKRLLWDARAASALNHPNIVCVYETGEAGGVEYVAMELVAGETLADLLEREPLTRSKVLLIATQIAGALEAAHAQGIVHRDLKPSNVMITPAGVAKLLDFGLAKSFGIEKGGGPAPTTIEGRLAGTVAYMSPEQAEGTEVDFRSDIFSFGSLLYEMLTRQRAFEGASTVSILARVIHTEPMQPSVLLPALDPRLDEIVQRCLRKDRERRFQSMAEVRVRLEEIADDPTPNRRPARTATLSPWTIAAGVAVAAIVGALAAAAGMRWGPRAPAPVSVSRLTWDGGLTTAPAISRDGTLLAYASDRSGRGDLDIWIQKMGGSDPIRLTADAADDSAPAISPDGTKVAYRSERGGGGMFVIPSLGGSERLLAPGCRDPKYSPNGETIACWTGDVGREFYPGSGKIWLVSASGGPLRPFRQDFEAAAFPLWLPDGSGLIFVGRSRDAGGASLADWWVAGESGPARATGALALLKERGLTPAAGGSWIRPQAWLESPSAVLFTARHEDTTSVWSIDASARGDVSGAPRSMTLSSSVEALPTAAGGSAPPSVVFASLSIEARLRRVHLPGADYGPVEPLLPTISQIGSPSISADGRLLVFAARQPNGFRVIAVDPATADQRLVTTIEAPDFVRVILSGDGRTIVYSAAGNAGYRMSLGGGLPEQICTRCGWPTHVNYNGTEALFESAQSDERLLLWSKGTVSPLIGGADKTDGQQFSGRFSPDGQWVALGVRTRDTLVREIFVVPNAHGRAIAADEWVPLSEGQTTDREPYWAPDGRRLFFISDRDGFRCLWARPMDPHTGLPAGPAHPVAHFHHARELLASSVASFSAIGLTASADSLIFTIAESTGNLWWRREGAR